MNSLCPVNYKPALVAKQLETSNTCLDKRHVFPAAAPRCSSSFWMPGRVSSVSGKAAKSCLACLFVFLFGVVRKADTVQPEIPPKIDALNTSSRNLREDR